EKPKQVYGDFLTGAYWHDTGDIPAYWRTSLALLDALKAGERSIGQLLNSFGRQYEEVQPGVWLSAGENAPESFQKAKVVGPAVIGSGCRFQEGSEIGPGVVIGDDCEMQKNAKIKNCVVLTGSKVKEGEKFEGGVLFLEQFLPAKRPA